MGNAVTVNLGEGTKMLEITEKLVRDFQYHINLVDHSMTGFARSIDSLRASCVSLQQQNDSNGPHVKDTSVGEEDDVIGYTQDMLFIETIDDIVSDHKFVVMESISRFFNFIIEIGNGCNIPTVDKIPHFSIDKYRDKSNVAHLGKDVQYCDARFESIQRKLKEVDSAYQAAKTDIENFNTREETYQKERNVLKKQLKDFETKVAELKDETGEHINQKNTLENREEEYSREIFSLKEYVKQIKNELSAEISSRQTVEEASKTEIDEFLKQVETLEREKKRMQTTIDDMHKENESLTNENESICADLKNVRHTLTTLQEENTSNTNSLNNEIDKLTAQSEYIKQIHEREIQRLEALYEKEQEEHINEVDKLRVESETRIQEMKEKETEMKESKTDILISDRMAELHTRDEKLHTSISLLNDAVKKMNIEHDDLKKLHQTEIKRLTICSEQAKLAEIEYIKTINDLKERLQRVDEDKKPIKKQVFHLENETKRLEADVKEKETEMEKSKHAHKDEIGICNIKIQKLKEKKREQRQTIETLNSEIHLLNCNKMEVHSQLQAEISKSVSLMEDQLSNNKSLQDKISKMNIESTELRELHAKENQTHEEAIEQETKGKKILEKQIKDLKEEQRRDQANITQLTDTNESLTSDIKQKQEQIDSLALKLEIASRKEIFVQVFHIPGFRSSKIEEEVQGRLKMRMVTERVTLQFLDCTGHSIVKPDLPLLLVCTRNNKTNRDRNISACTKERKDAHKLTALLMFHDKDEKSFQREVDQCRYSDDKMLGIFDIGYNKQGMYECETNYQNLENIINVILAVGEQNSKNVESAV